MKIHDFAVKFDKVAAYIPLVSAITYAITRIQKHVFNKANHENLNKYQDYVLNEKNWKKSKLYAIPFAKIIDKIWHSVRKTPAKQEAAPSKQDAASSILPTKSQSIYSTYKSLAKSATSAEASSEVPQQMTPESLFQNRLNNYQGQDDQDFLITALALMDESPNIYGMIAGTEVAGWKSNKKFLEVAVNIFNEKYNGNMTPEVETNYNAFINALPRAQQAVANFSDQGSLIDALEYANVLSTKTEALPSYAGMAKLFAEEKVDEKVMQINTIMDQGSLVDALEYTNVLSSKTEALPSYVGVRELVKEPKAEATPSYEGMTRIFTEPKAKVTVNYEGVSKLFKVEEPVVLPTLPTAIEIPETGVPIDMIPEKGVDVDFIPNDGCNIQ